MPRVAGTVNRFTDDREPLWIGNSHSPNAKTIDFKGRFLLDKKSRSATRHYSQTFLWRLGYKLFRERLEYARDLGWRKYIDYGRNHTWIITPIDSVFRLLELKALLPSPIVALETFGRQGLWKTVEYVHRCAYLEFYEIRPPHAALARRVLPADRTKVIAEDSILAVREGKLHRNDFNFVLIDSFPEYFGASYCEFFDFFPHLFNRLGDYAVIVINTFMTLDPGRDPDPRLLERRREFYGLADTQSARKLSVKNVLDAHARSVPSDFTLVDMFLVPHPGETVFVVMCVKRHEAACRT